jgi:hypothetical protein
MLSVNELKVVLGQKLMEKDQAFFKENFTNFYGLMSVSGLGLVFQMKDKTQLLISIPDKQTYFDITTNFGEVLGIPMYLKC